MAAEILFSEGAAPSTPSTDKGSLYLDTSNRLALKSEDGNTYVLAVLEKAQTFTSALTLAPVGTGVVPLTLTLPSGTSARAFRVDYIATEAIRMQAQAALSQLLLISRDLGNNVAGSVVQTGRNSNAGAEGGAAGTVQYITAAGNSRFTWVDGAGDVRVHSAAPTGSSGSPTVSDTAGTVVGTQTSWHEAKENIRAVDPSEESSLLQTVLRTPLYHFQMKEDGQRRVDNAKGSYTGLVITEQDRQNNAWFASNLGRQQIPTLNQRNLFGYMIGSIKAQQKQIEDLTRRLEILESTK